MNGSLTPPASPPPAPGHILANLATCQIRMDLLYKREPCLAKCGFELGTLRGFYLGDVIFSIEDREILGKLMIPGQY